MNKHHFDAEYRWRYKNRLEGDVWFRVLRLAYRGKQGVHENFVARQYQEAPLAPWEQELRDRFNEAQNG